MRLIDADELLEAMDTWDKFGNTPEGLISFRNLKNKDDYRPYVHYDDMVNCVKNSKTIIN